MSATLANITSWNARNGRDRQTAADNLDMQGRRRNGDRTTLAELSRPLRDVAREQGTALRGALATGRTVRQAEMQARVDAIRTAQNAPAPQARPAVASVGQRPTFKDIDAMAAKIPVGYYALRRHTATASGDVTFFKVQKFRGGHRIVQLVGGVGAYTERPLKLEHQYFALLHIGEDLTAAASLYGKESNECGFCAAQGRRSPLTHERSRKAGYGQHCAEKHGLPW